MLKMYSQEYLVQKWEFKAKFKIEDSIRDVIGQMAIQSTKRDNILYEYTFNP